MARTAACGRGEVRRWAAERGGAPQVGQEKAREACCMLTRLVVRVVHVLDTILAIIVAAAKLIARAAT